jgi:aminopeptidase N
MLGPTLSLSKGRRNRGRAAAICSCFVALFSSIASADTYPRQTGVDVIHYVFRLSLTPGSDGRITGETTIGARIVQAGTREIALDLASAAANGKGMTVSAVVSGGDSLKFTHVANRLTVTLAAPPQAGERVMFTVKYEGVPAAGLKFINNIHKEPTVFSENWPNQARQWLPTVDHPYDKATGELIITTSNQYQVVANGLLTEEVDLPNGLRETHWTQSVPIATWLYAIGIARFSSHHAGSVNGIPIQTWVFPQDRERGQALFERLSHRALAFFDEHVGRYSYEKLANVQAAGASGGMEHATAIHYGEKEVAEGRGPVVHEIAHQWFGDSVTERDWDDVWLSEGFATYFDFLFTEHDAGRDAFVERVKRSRDVVIQVERKLPDTPVIHRNLSDMEKVLNQLVYQKGAWVLHMLRYHIGDNAFWSGIRDYYARHQNQNASTSDLRASMEEASDLNLQWFFDQWLTRSGTPKVEGEWRYDAAKKQVEVTVRQTQAADAFRISFEIGVTGKDGRVLRHKVGTDRKLERYTIPFDSMPASVVLDPGTWLLYEAGSFEKVGSVGSVGSVITRIESP